MKIYDALHLTQIDLDRLNDDKWFSDNIMHIGIKMIKDRFGDLFKEEEVYVVNTFLIQQFIDLKFEDIERWVKQNIFKCKLIVFPFSTPNDHWSVFGVLNSLDPNNKRSGNLFFSITVFLSAILSISLLNLLFL